MGHGHAHHDHHGHSHGPPEGGYGRAFLAGIALNLGFVVVETVYGIVSGSVALVADAAHNLSDVLGLVLAWGAMVLAKRRPSKRHTYGWRKSTVLAALANAVLVLVAVGGVAWEAAERLGEPRDVAGPTVAAVAAAGVVINAASAALFAKGRHDDVNVKAAFLHLMADALVSLGVAAAGLVVWKTGWNWVDPAVSLVISVVIVWATWSVLREALDLALDAVPRHLDAERIESFLKSRGEVCDVHDLHVWAMSTTEVALTAHVVVTGDAANGEVANLLAEGLREQFGIAHATLQVEAVAACGMTACGSAEAHAH